MDNNFNESKNLEKNDSSVKDDEGIYGMVCTPGEGGYDYSPYGEKPTKGNDEKPREKKQMALALSLIITAALLGALCLLSIAVLDFFLGL